MEITQHPEVALAIANIFLPAMGDIKACYETIAQNFENNRTSEGGFLKSAKKNLSEKFSDHERAKWSSANLTGLDLPVLLKNQSLPKPTVFVLGIDPLRKRKDFPEARWSVDDIIVGTPYAIHSNYYRDAKGRTKVYWDFIQYLLKDFNVYLTDVYKIWLSDTATNNRNQYVLPFSKVWSDLLAFEIEQLRPKKIIAFGGNASTVAGMILGTNNSEKLLKLPHPSGRNSQWRNLIDRQTAEAKSHYLMNRFEELRNQ